jgi:TolB protein
MENPAWSPDGEKIAFARRPDGGVYEVFVIDVDGSNLMQITEVGPDASEYSSREPAWSPDGNRIAFSGRRDGDEFIHLINPDGNNVVILDNGTIHQEHPDWSPEQQ